MTVSPRTAVNQPPSGGSLYPFVAAGNLAATVLDVYLSYADPGRAHAWPFTLTVAAGNYTVTDATGAVVLVGLAAAAVTRAWGTRTVLEWTTAAGVLRVVRALPPTGAGVLDPRTCNRLPARVTSLRVGTVTMAGGVVFQAGYNVALTGGAPAAARVDGGRYAAAVNMDAVAGAGAGRLNGCAEVAVVVRKINQISPDCGGNFVVETDACFRAQLSAVVSGVPGGVRTAAYASPGLTAAAAAASVTLVSDCRPCCDCVAFVQTYAGLKRVWARWKAVAATAQTVRNLYEENRTRWVDARQCRLDHPARLLVSTDASCVTFMGGSFCNFTACCVTAIEIRFTLQKYTNGVAVAWKSGSVTEGWVSGSATAGDVRYTPAVTGPVIRFFIDYANPGATTVAKLKFCTTKCLPTQSLGVTLTVHAATPATPVGECVTPVVAVPAATLAVWAAAGVSPGPAVRAVVGKTVALNPVRPSFPCGC